LMEKSPNRRGDFYFALVHPAFQLLEEQA
jgi:hypothetical protein